MSSSSIRRLPVVTDKLIAPLRAAGTAGGRQVFDDHGELLVSNDDLIGPLQPFPGARLPAADGRTAFPVPDRVGEYCSREEFAKVPKFMAQWVHWKQRTELILEGKYDQVMPAHVEGIFTLVCNFLCPHCTRRVTRTDWVEGGTWNHNTEVDERNTLHPAGLRRVIDELASARTDQQMGIVWGGGDPTGNPFTYDGMLYAARRGITASFLTNGVFLDVDRALDADPILIRISLNCGTEEAYRRFHGYPSEWDYFDRVRGKMRELARQKLARRARTLVGISLIVDERNMDDIVAAAREIRAVIDDAGPGIDYVICRPVMNYAHFDHDYARLKDGTKERALALMHPGGAVYDTLHAVGIPLVLIKDSFDEPPAPEAYAGTDCLAYGLYGEIRHNGDLQLCSDSYGNPEYTIGNLVTQGLPEIWQSERRRKVLAKINEKRCFQTTCAHNSRGHHHNRVFHQIEARRRAGEMDVVHRWVEDLRATTLPLGHSFFV